MDNGVHGAAVIKQTKKWFSVHGIPSKVTSDNGPPWNGAEFKEFAHQYGFEHNTISPYHSQSNGKAERAVGIAKSLLEKCSQTKTDPHLALLNIRNTPRDEAGSPAQRLFSRRTQTRIPTAKQMLMPEIQDHDKVINKLYKDRHVTAKKHYDIGSKSLEPIRPGSTIRVRVGNRWQPALLLPNNAELNPRSYRIQLPSGHVTRRNRQDLLKRNEDNISERRHMDMDDDPPESQEIPASPSAVRRSSPSDNQSFEHVVPSDPTSNMSRKTNPDVGRKIPIVTRSGRMSRPPLKLDL